MNTALNQELEQIAAAIQEYADGPILPDPEDYHANKAVKTKLQQFIEKVATTESVNAPDKKELITKAIIILASNTGHHEDLEIAEDILDYLYNNHYINDEDMNTFNEHTGTGRME
jgi:hypothetical protein